MDYLCPFNGCCPYKSEDNSCRYLNSNLPEYFLYHLGEEKETACEDPYNFAIKEGNIN